MYYTYDSCESIEVPAPFGRTITPMFMGDDKVITESNFSIHMTEWQPGCQVDNHTHESSMEAMYCISGTGVAQVNGVEYPFYPGAMIVAPPKVTHQITNTGTQLLRVLCVFSPPWTGEDLKDRAMKTIAEARKLTEE